MLSSSLWTTARRGHLWLQSHFLIDSISVLSYITASYGTGCNTPCILFSLPLHKGFPTDLINQVHFLTAVVLSYLIFLPAHCHHIIFPRLPFWPVFFILCFPPSLDQIPFSNSSNFPCSCSINPAVSMVESHTSYLSPFFFSWAHLNSDLFTQFSQQSRKWKQTQIFSCFSWVSLYL